MSEWQNINTVPETGWGKTFRALVYSPRLGVKDAELGHFKGYIHASVACFSGNAVEDWGVTHWMPLPAPPVKGKV